jgi:hypothetical protein
VSAGASASTCVGSTSTPTSSLNGSDIGTVEIDPLAYGAYFRTHF